MSQPQSLYDLLGDGSEINIVCHNNPDPDCLASALALGRIAAAAGIDERRILYSGDISHQENRAFVNLLDIDLQSFDSTTVETRQPDSLLAFVDHSIPGENNAVPPDTDLDIDELPRPRRISLRWLRSRARRCASPTTTRSPTVLAVNTMNRANADGMAA